MDENSLGALRAAADRLKSETMEVRKAQERKVRMRDDGRANRVRQPTEKFSVDLPPGVKARIVAHCRRHGILIKDFALEYLERGLSDGQPE